MNLILRRFPELMFPAVAVAFVLSNSASVTADDDDIRFSRDILPIFSENCFFCHGPDEEQRTAELRLDKEDSTARVIDKNAPDQSQLLQRVFSTDPDEMMPPPDSNRHLTATQKEKLKSWVVSGAEWGRHWSFEPLVAPQVPPQSFTDAPLRNPIDAFVQLKLAQKKMRPSNQASLNTLLRRVTLDLTGLPPTPQEVEAFLADQSADAYEQVVERLLNSEAYGERMAWDWLDAARYADTNGYQGDRERTMWPWRDWVVNAFNNNMPFDEFTTLQLAGDLLPNATPEQILATGFCRNHMINGEGGRIPEENRVDYVMDMSETMGTVWLGLTLNCCRCHDHKYDPLTQREYYQFFAFFNQTPVTGGGGDPQTAPNIAAPTAAQKQRLGDVNQQLKSVQSQIEKRRSELLSQQTAWEQQQLLRKPAAAWQVLVPTDMSAANQTLRQLDDHSVLVEGTNAENDTYTLRYSLPAGRLSGIRLDALRHESMTKNGLARSDSGNFVLTDIACTLRQGETKTRLKISSAVATFEQGDLKVDRAFDGNTATGWAVYEGRPIDKDHAAVFRFENTVEVTADDTLQVVLRHDSPHKFHNLGHFRISATTAADPGLEQSDDAWLADLKVAPKDRSKEQKARIQARFLNDDSEFAKAQQQQATLTKQRDDINKAAPKVMVMQDRPEWRTTFVLNRGLYNDVTDKEVRTLTPASLPSFDSGNKPNNRLDLAQWLTSKQHPLTARVTVNRFWQQLFGMGLVKTTEDFGVQAEYPEQKDLLDWLSADFRDNGWNVKRLMRMIVTSHTYRQSSVNRPSLISTEAGQPLSLTDVDPENRLLARASRFRLPSWMLRDHALAVSGLLNRQVGGPPVNTYQPAGVWEEATFGKKSYSQDTGDSLYRRSLYVFWRRIIAPTMFFDNASRQSCTVKSYLTNTPLHALLTLNETSYVESARTVAQRLLSDSALSDDKARIKAAFLAILSREPSAPELQILATGIARSLREYTENPTAAGELLSIGDSPPDETLNAAEHAAWTSACLTLLNMDEALNRE